MTATSTPSTALRALSDDLAGAVERAATSIVAIHARPRIAASGIYWRDDLIVATSHTIRREEDIPITFPDGSRGVAELVGRDNTTDLAVLRLDKKPPASLKPPELAPEDALHVGSLVLAVGRPGDDGVSASLGIVSSVGDRWRTWSGGVIDRFVRLDLAIYDGFSGGALVDGQGRIAGVNCSALARGMPLTIPIATVERVLEALLTRGRVARGYLGVAMQPVRLGKVLAERLGLSAESEGQEGARGVLVVAVEGDSPADRAGLLVGDVLVAVGTQRVGEPQEVAEFLGAETVGKSLSFTVVRGGEKKTVALTVGERPGAEETASRGGRRRR